MDHPQHCTITRRLVLANIVLLIYIAVVVTALLIAWRAT